MNEQMRPSAARLPLFYVWSGSCRIAAGDPPELVCRETVSHVFVTAYEGSGVVRTGRESFAVAAGTCIIVGPGSTIRLDSPHGAWSAAFTSFDAIRTYGAEPDPEPLLPTGEIRIGSYSRFAELAGRLYDNREPSGQLEEYGNHALFQEMILIAMNAALAGTEPDSEQAVRHTIDQLRRSYWLDHSHQRLAEMAGLSPRQYSRIFQRITGKSPIDYLIGLRIDEAKRKLVDAREPLQEIAGSVGFRDPFHFSRSFKRHTGLSPKLYAILRKPERKVASLQYLGEMLSLGVKPAGAPSELMDGGYLRSRVDGIETIGVSVVTPDWDKLQRLKPDVIVTFDGHHYADYAKIAPTLDVKWQLPFLDRFRLIAEAVDKRREAEFWIARYHQRAREIREELAAHVPSCRTVSFFWSQGLPDTFQVYYDIQVLYKALAFASPPAVQAVQRLTDHPFKSDVPVADLPLYAGDYIFIVVSDDERSQCRFLELTRSALWRNLPAVRDGRAYRVTVDWVREDPLSLMGQLEDALALISRRGG